MSRRHRIPSPRAALALAALACLPAAIVCPSAGAAARVHARTAGGDFRSEAARVIRYWTPARMRSARPLDEGIGSGAVAASSRAGSREPVATASYTSVPDPTVPPFSVNGRLFVRQGRLLGFCSGTAINSPSRRLVLTAGHCVNSGPLNRRRRNVWSRFLEFVPAYSNGVAPFGVFVARRRKVFALKRWIRGGNPNFDLGAFLVGLNAGGQKVADAVGGGATIVTGQDRHQQFQTFAYPGTGRLQECDSPYVGDDVLTYGFGGPPTMAIRCFWRPGASGGGWLIDSGTEIDGITTYTHKHNHAHTFGPYFGAGTVGKLVAGL
jgi:hypothetical protein